MRRLFRRPSTKLLTHVASDRGVADDDLEEDDDTEVLDEPSLKLASFVNDVFKMKKEPSTEELVSIFNFLREGACRACFFETLLSIVKDKQDRRKLTQLQYNVLDNLWTVALKEASRGKAFQMVLDLILMSDRFYQLASGNPISLQMSIRKHSVIREFSFWQTVVCDASRTHVSRIMGSLVDQVAMFTAMSDAERIAYREKEKLIAAKIIKAAAAEMAKIGLTASMLEDFVTRMGQQHGIDKHEITSISQAARQHVYASETQSAVGREETQSLPDSNVPEVTFAWARVTEGVRPPNYVPLILDVPPSDALKPDKVREGVEVNKRSLFTELMKLTGAGSSNKDVKKGRAHTSCPLAEHAANEAGLAILPGEVVLAVLKDVTFFLKPQHLSEVHELDDTSSHPIPLFPLLQPVSPSSCRSTERVMDGVLLLTSYRVEFRPVYTVADSQRFFLPFFHVPLTRIARLKRADSPVVSIEIATKDGRVLQFCTSSRTNFGLAGKFFEEIKKEAFASSVSTTFAFCSRMVEAEKNKPGFCDGWQIFSVSREFMRQGVVGPSVTLDTEQWRLSDINIKFGLCKTYPQTLVVPKSITDVDLRKASEFRSKHRVPVLTWRHPVTLATLTRCSQPQVGITSGRHAYDEKLVRHIASATPASRARSRDTDLLIVDARPRVNAVANSALGGGYEIVENYGRGMSLHFAGIGNIHVMRNSLNSLRDLLDDEKISEDGTEFWKLLDETGWLRHLHIVLNNSVMIARQIAVYGVPVMVHCSDGWDRTSQLCALAQILMDPFYRTIEGFEVLIEKDFLSFGHKFTTRCGHVGKKEDSQRSPIFVQFLEAVWLIMEAFPMEFEFNDQLLLTIADEAYNCRFGTFLYDKEADRTLSGVQATTLSIWSLINSTELRPCFENPYYHPCHTIENGAALLPYRPHPAAMRLWGTYHYRWDRQLSSMSSFLHLPLPAHTLSRVAEENTNTSARPAQSRGNVVTMYGGSRPTLTTTDICADEFTVNPMAENSNSATSSAIASSPNANNGSARKQVLADALRSRNLSRSFSKGVHSATPDGSEVHGRLSPNLGSPVPVKTVDHGAAPALNLASMAVAAAQRRSIELEKQEKERERVAQMDAPPPPSPSFSSPRMRPAAPPPTPPVSPAVLPPTTPSPRLQVPSGVLPPGAIAGAHLLSPPHPDAGRSARSSFVSESEKSPSETPRALSPPDSPQVHSLAAEVAQRANLRKSFTPPDSDSHPPPPPSFGANTTPASSLPPPSTDRVPLPTPLPLPSSGQPPCLTTSGPPGFAVPPPPPTTLPPTPEATLPLPRVLPTPAPVPAMNSASAPVPSVPAPAPCTDTVPAASRNSADFDVAQPAVDVPQDANISASSDSPPMSLHQARSPSLEDTSRPGMVVARARACSLQKRPSRPPPRPPGT
eukprot:Rmarinus@m.28753